MHIFRGHKSGSRRKHGAADAQKIIGEWSYVGGTVELWVEKYGLIRHGPVMIDCIVLKGKHIIIPSLLQKQIPEAVIQQ